MVSSCFEQPLDKFLCVDVCERNGNVLRDLHVAEMPQPGRDCREFGLLIGSKPLRRILAQN